MGACIFFGVLSIENKKYKNIISIKQKKRKKSTKNFKRNLKFSFLFFFFIKKNK